MFFFSGTSLAAGAVLQSIQVENTGMQTAVHFEFSGPAGKIQGFDTRNPARIIVDFLNTKTTLHDTQASVVDKGIVTNYVVAYSAGRTRVVLNLKAFMPYTIKKSGNSVILTFANATAKEKLAKRHQKLQAFADKATHTIKSVDFKRLDNGGGAIIIGLSDAGMGVDFTTQADVLSANFTHTVVPKRYQHRYDVTDFKTPVEAFTLNRIGNTAHLNVKTSEAFEHTAYQVNNKFILEIYPANLVKTGKKSGVATHYTGKPLSLNFQKIAVRAVLQLLSDVMGMNLVASDAVQGDITLRLTDVPADEALAIVLQTQNLAKKEIGDNVFMIAPAANIMGEEKSILEQQKQVEALEPLKTELIHLNYAKATEIAKLIKDESTSLLTERGNVSVDERTNTLIVKDIPNTLVQVQRLLKELDVPVKQVLIEARIVDVETNYEEDLGIRWGVTKPDAVSGTIRGANAIQQNVIQGNPALEDVDVANRLNVNLPAENSSGIQPGSIGVALAKLGNGYLLDLELSAIENEGGGKVIASPRLVTADQHAASIESGQEIPYQEQTSSGATAVEFKKAVLSLEVTPQITPDNKIIMTLQVNQDRRSLDTEVQGTPAIDTKQIKTNVLVDNGETIVLGGIYEETQQHDYKRIPFLGDIPLLGVFFRSKSEVNDRKELLIFITPKIVEQTAYSGISQTTNIDT